MAIREGSASNRRDLAMPTAAILNPPAATALLRSPIPALRKLLVEETDEAVIIEGSVATYYFKQLAQETVMPVLCNRTLHNRVQVVRS